MPEEGERKGKKVQWEAGACGGAACREVAYGDARLPGAARTCGTSWTAKFGLLAKLGEQNWQILQIFCKFLAGSFSAVSKRNLQENMRLTAFFKLYKICILSHRCNLKIFAKNRFEKSAIFVKIQQKFCKSRKIIGKILPN